MKTISIINGCALGVLSMTLAACGGGGGQSDPSPMTVTVNAPLPILKQPLGQIQPSCQIRFSQQSANFADRVVVSGIPDSFGAINARVIAQQGTVATIGAAYFEDDPSTHTLIVPLHPVDPLAGGQVKIEVGDGQHACPAVTLNLNPLPAADPQVITRVRDKMAQWVDASIEAVGVNPSTLLTATADTIAPDMIAFAVAKKNISAGGYTRQQFDLAVKNNDKVFAGVLKQLDAEENFDRAIGELKNIPPLTSYRTGLKQASTPSASYAIPSINRTWSNQPVFSPLPQIRPMTTPNFANSAAANACGNQPFNPTPLPIHSAAELATRMQRANSSNGYLIRAEEQSSLGLGLGILALAPVAEISSRANNAGASLYVIKTIENARRALEPKNITAFTIGRLDTLLLEDRPATQAGRWDNVTVNAEGEEFNISSSILEGLITAAGLISGPVGTTVTASGVAFATPIGEQINELTKNSCVKLLAPKYGPIDVSDEEWLEFKSLGSAVKKINQRQYVGAEIGNAELMFKLRSEKFASNNIFEERRNVDVQEQRISLLPSGVRAQEAGDTVEISASIGNSFVDKSNLKAYISSAGGDQGSAYDNSIISQQKQGDLYTIRVKTSKDRKHFPVEITFDTLNPTLPPPPQYRARVATISLQGSLSLSEPSSCLQPNSTFDITSTLSGLAAGQRGVTWQVSGGQLVSESINADQTQRTVTFRTGTAGTMTIKATAVADGQVSDTVTVNVADSCFKKLHYSSLAANSIGNGDDGDCGAQTAPPTDFEQVFSSAENATLPPALPPESDYWYNRQQALNTNHDNHINYRLLNDRGTCQSIAVDGNTTMTARLYGENSGKLGMDFSADLTGNCVKHPANNEIYCANTSALGVPSTFYYLDIKHDTKVLLEGQLQCNGLTGYVVITPFSAIATRYEHLTTAYVPNTLSETLITDANGQNLPPVLLADFTCTQPNQTVSFSKEIIFKAPRQSNSTDRIVINTLGSVNMAVLGFDKTGFGPVDLTQLPVIKTGDFQSKGTVNFFIKVTPK